MRLEIICNAIMRKPTLIELKEGEKWEDLELMSDKF
jgi:hypothetical protein